MSKFTEKYSLWDPKSWLYWFWVLFPKTFSVKEKANFQNESLSLVRISNWVLFGFDVISFFLRKLAIYENGIHTRCTSLWWSRVVKQLLQQLFYHVSDSFKNSLVSVQFLCVLVMDQWIHIQGKFMLERNFQRFT